jgi:hypothetical protein
MRILLILIVFIIGLQACHEKNTVPNGILNKGQMQDVLWDIMQADAFTNSFIKKDSSKNAVDEDILLQKRIFLIHGISQDDFYKSYSFYKDNPALMLAVLDSITAKETRNEGIQQKSMINHAAILDSIKLRAISNKSMQLKERTNPSVTVIKPKIAKKKKSKHPKQIQLSTHSYYE